VPVTTIADLERLPATAHPEKLADLMRRDGALIIENLLPLDVVTCLDAELEPWVATRRPGFRTEHHDDSFYGSNTIRVQGLARKSETFVHEVLLHPTLQAIADAILLPYCGDYWMSQAETIFIGPGNAAQELHRDDLNWAFAAQLRIDLQVSVLVALGEYTPEVGSTMVIPGSHTWPLDRPIDPADAAPIELEPGSALVYLGSTVHGGGENRTLDRWRKALYLSYLVGWLTPEEAVPMGIGHEHAARLPERARELLGFANLRQPGDAEGAGAVLELWQLDADDLAERSASFHHR
jgi:ectoine hydroxylase-related dioxygenase (phytanoyl-CoA dioxygenase family)